MSTVGIRGSYVVAIYLSGLTAFYGLSMDVPEARFLGAAGVLVFAYCLVMGHEHVDTEDEEKRLLARLKSLVGLGQDKLKKNRALGKDLPQPKR